MTTFQVLNLVTLAFFGGQFGYAAGWIMDQKGW